MKDVASVATLLIGKCSSTTSIRKARQLHALILTSAAAAIVSGPYAFNNIVSMYGRCGSYKDSQLMFDEIPQRNIVSYNALISAYSRSAKHAPISFHLLAQLANESLRPNGSTFTSLLQASLNLKSVILGFLLHAQCVKFGFLDAVCVRTSLLGLYSSCGDLRSAAKVFDSITYKDEMSWNTIIHGYMANGKLVKGLEMFNTMLISEAKPDQFTFSMVLNACGSLGDHDTGKLAHARSLVLGTCFDLPLHNAILDMYCSCGDTDSALSAFKRIDYPDLVSWNTIIAGFSEVGDGAKAMDMFAQLRRGFATKPDEYTYAAIMSAIGGFPAFEYGKPLHAQIQRVGLERSAYVGSTLISMYFSNADTRSAQKIFDSVSEKDVVLWTHMVAGHSQMGDGETALKIFNGMSREGHKIDSYALSIAISACADLAILRQGQTFHSLAAKLGYASQMIVCGSLVNMYAKVGDLQASEMAFSKVIRPDLTCWNSLLGGYGHHGRAKDAFVAFVDILKQGLQPDQVTFLSLFTACSHCGWVDEGKYFWNYMKERGLKPGPKHYSGMITLLSRAGLLEEAEETIMESPFGDDYLELWRTLLSSCVMKGDMQIAMHAAKHISSIDAQDTATNVLLAKLYAVDGIWDGVAETRRKIRRTTFEKDPGLSWTAVTHEVQVFSSGDQAHPKNNEIQVELRRLLKHSMATETDEI